LKRKGRRASRDEGDALTAVEVAGALRLGMLLEVLPRRPGGNNGGSNYLSRDHRRVGQRAFVDGQIDALVYEVGGAIGDHDLDDVRKAGEELTQPR